MLLIVKGRFWKARVMRQNMGQGLNQEFNFTVQIKSSSSRFKSRDQVQGLNQESKFKVQIRSPSSRFKSRVQVQGSNQESKGQSSEFNKRVKG